MKRRIRRTKQFRDDLLDIYAYIYRRTPRGAEKVFDAIERSVKGLLRRPGAGGRWDSPDPRLEGMRVTVVTPYRNYLIFFRAAPDGVEAFRVIHGAQELDRIVDEIDIEFEDE